MMEEQPFGLPQYKSNSLLDFLNNYIETKNVYKSDCESASLTLCWYLQDINCLAAQAGGHTVVLFNQICWIDLTVGIVLNKDFSQYQKLKNFNQNKFDTLWGVNGNITNSDFIFTLIKVLFYRKIKFK